MTIDEAIKRLEVIKADLNVDLDSKDIKALTLGIEALERFKQRRAFPYFANWETLLGETKEVDNG